MDDVGGRLSWSALSSFIKYLRPDSALGRDLGKYTGWDTPRKTNEILADIFDMLQVIDAHVLRIGGGKRKKLKPYPRPNLKDEDKKIGKGALPYSELQDWFEEKRKWHQKEIQR